MDTTVLDQLKNIDLVRLHQVVRHDLNRPAFEISDWSVRPLSDQGVINPDGLFLFEGHGIDADQPALGVLSWSVVVKNFITPPEEPAPDDLWYWKREIAFFQSGLPNHLPGPVHPPRGYGVFEIAGSWQVWMEHVHDETPPRWTMEQYRFAARELGRWNGKCYQQHIYPDEPWLCREHYRGWLVVVDNIPAWRDANNPLMKKFLSPEEYSRACQLCDDRELFITTLNRLPQVFSHFDTNRRNLMIRKNTSGHDELVVIDWACVGMGPLGGELNGLIGASGLLSELEMEDLPALEAIVYPEYLAGLRDEGWAGDPDEIRLAYTAWIALWLGAAGPALIAAWTEPQLAERVRSMVGCEQEDLAANFGKLCQFGLERADEARDRINARAAD